MALAQGGLERPQPGWASAHLHIWKLGDCTAQHPGWGRLESRASLRAHCEWDRVGPGPAASASPGSKLECPTPTPADPGSGGICPLMDSAAPEVGQALPRRRTHGPRDSSLSPDVPFLSSGGCLLFSTGLSSDTSCLPGARSSVQQRRLRGSPCRRKSPVQVGTGGFGQILAALITLRALLMVPTEACKTSAAHPREKGAP